MEQLEEEVKKVLMWLKSVFELDSTRTIPSRRTPSVRGGGPPSRDETVDLPERPGPTDSSLDEVPDDEVDDEYDELEQLRFIRKSGGWDLAAFRWLTRCYLHMTAIARLGPNDNK